MADVTIDQLTTQIKSLNRELSRLQGNLNKTAGAARSGGSVANGMAGFSGGTGVSTYDKFSNAMGGFSGLLGNIAGAAGGAAMMMPNVAMTMGRQRAFYEGGAMAGFSQTRRQVEAATKLPFMTDPTSRATVAAILQQNNFTAGTQQYATAAQYTSGLSQMFGMSNEAAAMSVSSFYSGDTAGAFFNRGIMMTGANGQEKSPTEMFEEFFQRIYNGPMNEEQVNAELQRGMLNVSIRRLGLDPGMEQALRTYIKRRYSGKSFDLGNQGSVDALVAEGKSKGYNNTMRESEAALASSEERLMSRAESGYDEGITDATNFILDLNKALEPNVEHFSKLNAQLQTLLGNERVQGGIVVLTNILGAIGNIEKMFGIPNIIKNLIFPGGGDGQGGIRLAGVGGGHHGGANILPGGNPIITSAFGQARDNGPHKGTDYAVPEGTSVASAADGEVIESTRSNHPSGGYGEYIKVLHNNGITTLYAHLSKRGVAVGTKVKAGQEIGKSGNTGFSTGPHLHFEVIDKSGNRRPPSEIGVLIGSSKGTKNENPSDGHNATIDGDTLDRVIGQATQEIPGALSMDPTASSIDEILAKMLGQNQDAGDVPELPKSISRAGTLGGGTGGDGRKGVRMASVNTGSTVNEDYSFSGETGSRSAETVVNAPVTIHVNLNSASETEAKKLVAIVKQELDKSYRRAKTGAR